MSKPGPFTNLPLHTLNCLSSKPPLRVSAFRTTPHLCSYPLLHRLKVHLWNSQPPIAVSTLSTRQQASLLKAQEIENIYTWEFFIFRKKGINIMEDFWRGLILENDGGKIHLKLCTLFQFRRSLANWWLHKKAAENASQTSGKSYIYSTRSHWVRDNESQWIGGKFPKTTKCNRCDKAIANVIEVSKNSH